MLSKECGSTLFLILDKMTDRKYDLYNKSYLSYKIEWRDFMKIPKGKYAWTLTVGEKGQFVIPKQAREVFGIKPGDTLILLGDEEKGIAIPPKSTFAKYMEEIFSDQ